MNGAFLIKYKNGKTEYLAHNFIFAMNPINKRDKLGPLREQYRLKQLELFCTCTKPHVKMCMSHQKATNNYSIKSMKHFKDSHDQECFYSRRKGEVSLSSNSLYETGFIKQDNGLYNVNLDAQDYKATKKEKNTKQSDTTESTAVSILQGNSGVSSNKPTIYAMMLRLVTEAWNNAIQFDGLEKYPKKDASTILEQLEKFILKSYSVEDKLLKNLFYKGVSPGKIYFIQEEHFFKIGAFTLLLLEDSGIKNNGDTYTLSIRHPDSPTLRNIDVPKALYENAHTAINQMSGPFLAGGFVVATGFNKTPSFISFGLVPINDYGVPVESSYERRLYNQLCDEKRLFTRPFAYEDNRWNGFIPDGLLLDTKPKTIIEVFGMSESVESYHEKRAMKIHHFSDLNPFYNFWYWDAFKDETLPPSPK